jgi:glycosyltransferase involved in cell wall biosynthesis
MKVFFPVGAFYPSQVGGPCNTLYWHTCTLNSIGVETKIVTTSLGINMRTVELNKMSSSKCGLVFYGSSDSISFTVLDQIISGIKSSDVIHLNSVFDIFSIVSLFYTKLFYPRKRIIWSPRGELNPIALGFSKYKKKILLIVYKRWTKGIVFHSTSEKETEEIKEVLGDVKIIEIPNGLVPTKRMEMPLKNQFLYLGRIHRIKGIHKMIEGFSRSKRFMDTDFKLIIVGKHEDRHSDYYQEIQQLAKFMKIFHKIEFKGHIDGVEKETIYAESYALALLSDTENFGNVVIEALNHGTPIIASKGTPWSILDEFNCGFHIDNSPEKIAEIVDMMIDLPQQDYLNMRKNAVFLLESKFNIYNQLENWISIYKD